MSNFSEENRDIQQEPMTKETTDTSPKKKVEYDESLFEGSTVFSAPVEDKKKKRAPRFKPTARGILFSAIAVVIAAAVALTVFLLPEGNKGGSSSQATTPSYKVVALTQHKVADMVLYNANGSIRIYPDLAKETEEKNSDDTSREWLVEGYEKYNLSGAELLVNGAIEISSPKKLVAAEGALLADDYADKLADLPYGTEAEEGEEANVYGFDRPFAAFTINGNDEKDSRTVLLGCYSPDGAGRYVSVTGDRNVYIVNDSNFNNGKYEFTASVADLIDPSLTDAIEQNSGTAEYFVDGTLNYIDTIVLSGSCRSRMVIETAPEELSAIMFVVTEPSFRAGNEENIFNYISIAEGNAYAEGAYVLGYSKNDLAEYGLNNPYSVIEINIGTYHAKLTFGAERDGYYPCVVEGRDIIYKVAAVGNEWVAYVNKDVYFDSLFLEYIANISELTVETQEKSVTFYLEREKADDGLDFDVRVKDYEDLKIDTDELCYYYGRILNLAAEEYTTSKSPTDEPFISFKIKYIKENRSDDEIALYRYSTRRYLYTLNGEGDALVAAAQVQDLYDCLDTLLAGETIGRSNYY